MANMLMRSSLRISMFSPLNCRNIISLRIRSSSTDTEGQSNSNKNLNTCVGVNYLKEGTDPPLLPDNEYPDWLWKLMQAKDKNTDQQSKDFWRKTNKKNRRQENEIRKQKRLK